MSDNRFSPNYYNSVYNKPKSLVQNEAPNLHQINENLNESNQLKEINNRLDFYINAVKDLTQYIKFTNLQSPANHHINTNQTIPNNSLLFSMRNLEKDLEALKQLYEEEIKLMKFEIEELST
ncbi:unnamed protein product, partial [Brachionus calyciflorus]